jgi:hypothetical protein
MLFVVAWAGGAVISAAVLLVYWRTLPGPPTALDGIKAGMTGGVMACLLGYATYHLGYCQLASAELSDELLRGRTLFADRTTDWSDVGAVFLKQHTDPKASSQLDIVRVDGQRLTLMIPPDQGQPVYEMFQDVMLNDEWAGAPHTPVRIWGYILLGLAVAIFGVWLDFEVVREALAGRLWNMQNQNDLKKLFVKLVLAVMAPVGGTIGFVTGAYHLVRRPIVVTPGFHFERIESRG